ncbi:hypothetical protein LCGC14_2767560, partial [marine sediment metagenome]
MVEPAQQVSIDVVFFNNSLISPPVDVSVEIWDQSEFVASLPTAILIPPPVGDLVTLTFPWAVPGGLADGLYSVRVLAVEQGETVWIYDSTWPVFTVSAPPPIIPLALGDLTLQAPEAIPAVVSPGDMVTLRVPIANSSPSSPEVDVAVYIIDSQGLEVELMPTVTVPEMLALTTLTFEWTVPGGLADGLYGVRVLAAEPGQPGILDDQAFDVIEVAVGGGGLIPGDIELQAVAGIPAEANPGDLVLIDVRFMNNTPFAASITVGIFIY